MRLRRFGPARSGPQHFRRRVVSPRLALPYRARHFRRNRAQNAANSGVAFGELGLVAVSCLAVLSAMLFGVAQPVTTNAAVGTALGVLTQAATILENDDQAVAASVDGNSQLAAANTSVSASSGQRLTARFQLRNTTNTFNNANLGLFYDRNDGIFKKVQSDVPQVPDLGYCGTIARWNCDAIQTTPTNARGLSVAVDQLGRPWMAFDSHDTNNWDHLEVAHYVGRNGSGCSDLTLEWKCEAITGGNEDSGLLNAMVIDARGKVWIAYLNDTDGKFWIATNEPSAGTCGASGSNNWTCTELADGTSNLTSDAIGMAIDENGYPAIAFDDESTGELHLARYRPNNDGDGTCATLMWTGCAAVVDSGGHEGVSLAFLPSGDAVLAFQSGDMLELAVEDPSGTDCGGSGWGCYYLDETSYSGNHPSIAIDPAGKIYVSYFVYGASDLKELKVVTEAAGQTCGGGATGWSCQTLDSYTSATTVGINTSLAFDAVGQPWIAYPNIQGSRLMAAHVKDGSWVVDGLNGGSGQAGRYASLAFGPDGTAFIAATSGAFASLAYTTGSGDIVSSPGNAGVNGATISQSHADMTTASDSANRSDADCITGGTGAWVNGKWFSSSEGSGVSLAANKCTEVAFTVSTAQATTGKTYRLAVASKDNWQPDKGVWRGPVAITNYATFTVSAQSIRYSKTSAPDFANCDNSTAWGCVNVDTGVDRGEDSQLAFDQDDRANVVYRYGNGSNSQAVRFASYTPGSTSGCGGTANWTCSVIEANTSTNGGVTANFGRSTNIAVDRAGQKWASWQGASGANALELRVGRYVGAGNGSGCTGTNSGEWKCWTLSSTGSEGLYNSMALDANGYPWIAWSDATNGDLKVAHYLGPSATTGTGCYTGMTDWNCYTVDDEGSNASPNGVYARIALDNKGRPWIAYKKTLPSVSLSYARFVGNEGSGCSPSKAWTCGVVTTDTPFDIGFSFDANNRPYVSFGKSDGSVNLALYLGSLGTCPGSGSAWSCGVVKSDGPTSASARTGLAFDSANNPWLTWRDATDSGREVANYVGSGGNCGSGYWASAFNCTVILGTQGTAYAGSGQIAFDRSGTPWVTANTSATQRLYIAKLHAAPTQPSAAVKRFYPGSNAYRGDARYVLDAGTGVGVSGCAGGGYCGVATASDGYFDSMSSVAGESPTYVFAKKVAANTSKYTVNWIGKSTVAPSSAAVTLQAYRFGSVNAWETISPSTNTCSSTGANTACSVSGQAAGTTSQYFEADGSEYWMYFRVSQAYGSAQTLSTDAFTYALNQTPNAPTSLAQKDAGNTTITTGNWTNTATVTYSASVSDPDASDTLQLCVEVKALASAFTGVGSCGTGVAYSGSAVTASVSIGSLVSGTQYHWQAWVKDAATAVSSAASYGANAEAAADFGSDTTAPAAGVVYDGLTTGTELTWSTAGLDTLKANWTSSGFSDASSGIASYTYRIGTTAGGSDVKADTTVSSATTAITVGSLNLNTGQTYYVRVFATDNAGNVGTAATSPGQSVSPTLTFSLSASAIDFGALGFGNSYTGSGSVNTTVSTNAHLGYSLSMFAATTLTGPSTFPTFTSGTWASPSTSVTNGVAYTSSDTNVSGSNRFLGGTAYAPLPVGSTNANVIADHTATVDGSTGEIVSESFTLGVRAKAQSTQAAGQYSATVVITCIPQY